MQLARARSKHRASGYIRAAGSAAAALPFRHTSCKLAMSITLMRLLPRNPANRLANLCWLCAGLCGLCALVCARESRRDSEKNLKTGISRHIRSLAYPDASAMGIFFAIGIPIDVPDKSISLSFYFEANYQIPHINNSGQINAGEYFNRKRSLDRQLLYRSIENQFDSYGYRGRACLQRTICESAQFPFAHSGLVGDLARIIFTPSSSLNENLEPDLEQAEYADDCLPFQQQCPMSLLDLISHSHTNDAI